MGNCVIHPDSKVRIIKENPYLIAEESVSGESSGRDSLYFRGEDLLRMFTPHTHV